MSEVARGKWLRVSGPPTPEPQKHFTLFFLTVFLHQFNRFGFETFSCFVFLLTLNCLTELDLLEFKLCSFSSKFCTCEKHLWWRVMACIVRSVGDLEGIKHSLLGGFQTSFNKPAVIQRTEGCIVALQPPLCAGGALNFLSARSTTPWLTDAGRKMLERGYWGGNGEWGSCVEDDERKERGREGGGWGGRWNQILEVSRKTVSSPESSQLPGLNQDRWRERHRWGDWWDLEAL